ncbi:MAG: asparagine synthetase B family protein, partial [Bacteroidota bacterium]
NEPALAEYVCTQTVHEPYTLIQDIFILEPGTYLHFNKERSTKHKYYHLPQVENDCSLAEIRNKLRSTLSQSVEQHLRSDVNFGAFLSGGIDSSLLVALMHEVSEDKISTFNIAFKEDEFNESEYAKIIAKKYNTEHFEVLLNANDFLNEIPNAVQHIDFPSGDGPNTYVVTEAAKKAGLTVAVSGLGGDELFGGYPVFRNMHEIKKSPVFKLPKPLRKILSTGINLSQNNDTGRRKAAMLNLGSHNLAEIYTQFRTVWHTSEILNSNFSLQSSTETSTSFQLPNRIITSVSLSEIQGYMHDVLLRDSDQMSMAHAFEIRVPFLDHRVVECALEIPDKFKFPHKTKQFLTDTYSDILPSEIVNRPKMGFTLPWKLWMKNELKTYCEEGLEIISTLPPFDEKKLNLAWNDFLKGSNKKPFTSFWHLVVLGHWLKQNSISTP